VNNLQRSKPAASKWAEVWGITNTTESWTTYYS